MLRFLRSKPSELDDATLLARFQKTGRGEDLSPLFERYLELIYSVCLKYLGDREKAEDAVMEVFEHLLKKLPGQEIKNFRSWLQTVVRNHCLMKLRKNKRDPLTKSDELLVHSGPLAHLVQEEVTVENPYLPGLSDCLTQLSAEQLTCIRLFYLEEGNTYKTIAEQTKLDLGRVRSYIQNGRRKLKICLENKVKTKEL